MEDNVTAAVRLLDQAGGGYIDFGNLDRLPWPSLTKNNLEHVIYVHRRNKEPVQILNMKLNYFSHDPYVIAHDDEVFPSRARQPGAYTAVMVTRAATAARIAGTVTARAWVMRDNPR